MNLYQPVFINGKPADYSLGKIVCVGRNYAEHAKELNNPIPDQPLLFIKPATAAVDMRAPIALPVNAGDCHHELEVSILIGKQLTSATKENALEAIAGIGLGLDLTLRGLQSTLKKKGHPWERAKAFDGSCPLSPFAAVDDIDLKNLELRLFKNGALQQSGNTSEMLFSVTDLLVNISQSFSLMPGDVVMTGTPAGVGPLESGNLLRAELGDLFSIETRVL